MVASNLQATITDDLLADAAGDDLLAVNYLLLGSTGSDALPASLFPFSPDWSTPVKVSRTFKTDIITSRSGKEQRRALRRSPRKSFDFSITVTSPDLARLNNFLMQYQGAPSLMPDPTGQSTTQFVGFLQADLSGTRLTNWTAKVPITFDVDPTSEGLIVPPAATTLFNSREYVPFLPNWGSTINLGYGHPFEPLDFGQGRISYYRPIAFQTRTWQATFLQRAASEMQLIEQWFERALGRRGEFYMPTWEPDLVLGAPIAVTDTSFVTAGADIFNAYATDTVFRAVMISFNDGTQLPLKITGIVLSGGNSQINVGAPVGRAVAVADVAMISWMPVWRHASDTMTSEWLTDSVAQNQLTLQTVEDLQPEV